MSKRIHILGSACNMIGSLIGVLGCLLRFARLMLVAKLLAAESRLAACVDAIDRKKAPKPRFKLSFRLLRIALSRLLPEWRKLAHVMQPHQGLGGETPVPYEAPRLSEPTKLVSTPVLGGVHHTYRRVAA